MSNRYDNGSVSAYTPQSFQELSFVPLMKRAQHDEMSKNLAELDAIATDPLNEHKEEALRLKQEFEGKLGNISGNLASKGIDSIGVGDFYKLKKEHDDLIAPTGEIGIINNANKVLALEKENFYKNADKSFGQDRLNAAWDKHREEYASRQGRDKNGKITNIGNLGSPKYIDREKTVTNILSTVGHETTDKLINSGQKFVMTPYGVGTQDTQGNITTKTNDKQLQNVLDSLSSQFFVKGSEGRISGDFENRSLQNDIDYINGRVLGAKIYEKDINQKVNYGWTPQSGNNGNNGSTNSEGNLYGDPYDTQTIGGEKQDLSEIEQIGNDKASVSSALANSRTGLQGSTHKPMSLNGKWTTEDIKDPIQKLLYNKAWKDATTGKGIMLTNGKIGHLTKESIALGKNDPTVKERLLNHLKLSPSETFQDKIIKTNQQYKANGFPGYANKNQTDQDKQVRNDLKIGGTEGRKIIVNGKPIELNKFLKDYNANLEDITFSGIKSFDRIESKNDVLGSNGSKSSPLMITVKTKDNQYLPFTTTRIASDNQGINPLRMDDIQKNKLKIMLGRDEFQDFKSNSKSLNGLKVRRNVNENINYDPETGELLEYTVKDKNGKDHYYTSDEYLTNILATK